VGTRPIGIVLFGVSYLTIQNLDVEGANGKPTNGAVYAQASNSLVEAATTSACIV